MRLGEKFKERFGDGSSKFAEEGTAAHSMAELKLRREIGEINDFSYKEQIKTLKTDHPDYDWNRIDWSTNIYVDTVMSNYYAAKKTTPDAKLLIETRVSMESIVKGCWGTSDAIVVSDTELVVQDYKNGSGVPVSAENNPQARLYGLGALLLLGDLYGFDRIRTVIIQPNLDSITEETLTREELLSWAHEIAPRAEEAYEGRGEFHSGDWCRFCPVRALCYHRAVECMSIFKDLGEPGVIPDSEIPKLLEVIPEAKKWMSDVEEYAQSQALKGQHFPGFKLVYGRRPPRKWIDENDVADQLSRAGYKDELIYPRKLISVGDAEKLLGKQAFRAILGQLTSQSQGAPTLVPESDKRLSINSAEAAFADLAD